MGTCKSKPRHVSKTKAVSADGKGTSVNSAAQGSSNHPKTGLTLDAVSASQPPPHPSPRYNGPGIANPIGPDPAPLPAPEALKSSQEMSPMLTVVIEDESEVPRTVSPRTVSREQSEEKVRGASDIEHASVEAVVEEPLNDASLKPEESPFRDVEQTRTLVEPKEDLASWQRDRVTNQNRWTSAVQTSTLYRSNFNWRESTDDFTALSDSDSSSSRAVHSLPTPRLASLSPQSPRVPIPSPRAPTIAEERSEELDESSDITHTAGGVKFDLPSTSSDDSRKASVQRGNKLMETYRHVVTVAPATRDYVVEIEEHEYATKGGLCCPHCW